MKLISLIYILLLGGSTLFAQVPEGFSYASDIESIRKNIMAVSDRTNTISSDFTQEKHLTMIDEVLVSDGKFLFKKENNVLWKYLSPINYSIVVKNNRFIINNGGKISEFDTESSKLFKEINKMIVMAIRGNFMGSNEFKSLFFENEEFYLARLTPNDEQLRKFLTTIDIYFDKNSYAVSRVKFIEAEDDYTMISFSNRRENIEISEAEFDDK